MQLGQPLPF